MRFYSKKAQSAMEYLMTYGWAILIILIAVGALFYLGVFSPSTPSTCTATAPITCVDLKAIDKGGSISDEITLNLGATAVSSAIVTSMTVNGIFNTSLGTPAIPVDECRLPEEPIISTTTPGSITLTCANSKLDLKKGDKYSGTATVTYKLEGSTIVHTSPIQFSGTVE